MADTSGVVWYLYIFIYFIYMCVRLCVCIYVYTYTISVLFAKTTKNHTNTLEWSLVRGNVNHLELWAGVVADRGACSTEPAHPPPSHACPPPACLTTSHEGRAVLLGQPLFWGAAAMVPAASASPGCAPPASPGRRGIAPPPGTRPWRWLRARPDGKLPSAVEATAVFPWWEGKSKRNFESSARREPVSQKRVGSCFQPQPLRFSQRQQVLLRQKKNLPSRGGRFDGSELNKEDYSDVKRQLEA